MADIAAPYKPLNIKEADIFITGGTSGIGKAFIDELYNAGVKNIITCGRRVTLLDEMKKKYPNLITIQADVGQVDDRRKLAKYVIDNHPDCNVLINNAGVQRTKALRDERDEEWNERQSEIDINCCGPVHLTSLFAQHFISKPEAAIVNITSGLAFVPSTHAPVYAATKAFLHSFCMTSRVHFSETNVQVIEIAPPAVVSNLGGDHDFGEPADQFAKSVLERFYKGEKEIGYKMSEKGRNMSREQVNQAFDGMNERMKAKIKPFERVSSL